MLLRNTKNIRDNIDPYFEFYLNAVKCIVTQIYGNVRCGSETKNLGFENVQRVTLLQARCWTRSLILQSKRTVRCWYRQYCGGNCPDDFSKVKMIKQYSKPIRHSAKVNPNITRTNYSLFHNTDFNKEKKNRIRNKSKVLEFYLQNFKPVRLSKF